MVDWAALDAVMDKKKKKGDVDWAALDAVMDKQPSAKLVPSHVPGKPRPRYKDGLAVSHAPTKGKPQKLAPGPVEKATKAVDEFLFDRRYQEQKRQERQRQPQTISAAKDKSIMDRLNIGAGVTTDSLWNLLAGLPMIPLNVGSEIEQNVRKKQAFGQPVGVGDVAAPLGEAGMGFLDFWERGVKNIASPKTFLEDLKKDPAGALAAIVSVVAPAAKAMKARPGGPVSATGKPASPVVPEALKVSEAPQPGRAYTVGKHGNVTVERITEKTVRVRTADGKLRVIPRSKWDGAPIETPVVKEGVPVDTQNIEGLQSREQVGQKPGRPVQEPKPGAEAAEGGGISQEAKEVVPPSRVKEPWEMTTGEFGTSPELPQPTKPGYIVAYHRLANVADLDSVLQEGLLVSKKGKGAEGPPNALWGAETPTGYSKEGTVIAVQVPEANVFTKQGHVAWYGDVPVEDILWVDKHGYSPVSLASRISAERTSEYAPAYHKAYVEQALSSGKRVPEAVVDKFIAGGGELPKTGLHPEIASKYVKPSTTKTSPPGETQLSDGWVYEGTKRDASGAIMHRLRGPNGEKVTAARTGGEGIGWGEDSPVPQNVRMAAEAAWNEKLSKSKTPVEATKKPPPGQEKSISFDELSDRAKGAIASDARVRNQDLSSFIKSRWRAETVTVESLRESNKDVWGDEFVHRGSMTKEPIIVDENGRVLDGNNRLREAINRGDATIEIMRRAPELPLPEVATQPPPPTPRTAVEPPAVTEPTPSTFGAITGAETDAVFVRMKDINTELSQMDQQLRVNPEMEYLERRELTNKMAELHREKQLLQPKFDEWVEIANAQAKSTLIKPTPQPPKLETPGRFDVYDFAEELHRRGIERQASYSRYVQRMNLKPEMDAKEWFKIYDSVAETANIPRSVTAKPTPSISEAKTPVQEAAEALGMSTADVRRAVKNSTEQAAVNMQLQAEGWGTGRIAEVWKAARQPERPMELGAGVSPSMADDLTIRTRTEQPAFVVERPAQAGRDYTIIDRMLQPLGIYDGTGSLIQKGVYDRLGEIILPDGRRVNLGTEISQRMRLAEHTIREGLIDSNKQINQISTLVEGTIERTQNPIVNKRLMEQRLKEFVDLVEKPFDDSQRIRAKEAQTPIGEALRLHDTMTEQFRQYIIDSRRQLGIEVSDNWGITDKGYFRHLFLGDIKLFKGGKLVGMARTYAEAQKMAIDILKEDPSAKLTARARTDFFGDPTLRVTARQYMKVVGKLAEEVNLSKEEIMADLRGTIGQKSRRQKWFGALLKRKGTPGYSKAYGDVMRIHAFQMYRTQELSKMNRAIQPKIEILNTNGKPGLAAAMTEHVKDLWGTPSNWELDFGRAVENTPGLRNYVPVPSMAFRGLAERLTGLTSLLTIRSSPRSALVNRLQPFATLWPYIETSEFIKLWHLVETPSVRKMLMERGVLETTYKLETPGLGIGHRLGSEANPLNWFRNASAANRGMGYMFGYRRAMKRGLAEAQAHVEGMSWAEKVEFNNSVWNVQAILRSPGGRILGQFKSFAGKNIENARDVWMPEDVPTGERVGRAAKWTAAQIGIGGVKSAGVLATAIGGYKLVEHLSRQLQNYGMDKDDADKLAQAVYYGAPSLIGQDLSASVTIFEEPFGRTALEKGANFVFGPSVGRGLTVGSALLKGDEERAFKLGATSLYKAYDVGRQVKESGFEGLTMNIGGKDEPLTPFEGVMRSLGFTPLKQSEFYEKREAGIGKGMKMEKALADTPRVLKELKRLKVNLGSAGRTLTIDDKPTRLEDEEYVEHDKRTWEFIKSTLSKEIERDDYKAASDEDKVRIIRDAANYARDQARELLTTGGDNQ